MNDYAISNYGIFSDAVSSTNTFGTSINNMDEKLKNAQTTLSNESVFKGPIQENCMTVFQKISTDITGIIDNFKALSNLIGQISSSYQTGDANASKAITGTTDTSSVINLGTAASANMRNYSYNGRNFNVVSTNIPIEDYEAYVQKNKIYQNAGFLDGQCMLLSQYYAKDLLTGKYTSKSTMQDHSGGPAVRMNERCKSTNEQEVLNYTYNELTEGHPVVLQVSQIHSDQGARHLVTAVGYDSTVRSAADLNPNNLLVLDCVDGKLQTLGLARASGGHERRLFAQGGNYQALGPTNEFLSKEVTTTTTSASMTA